MHLTVDEMARVLGRVFLGLLYVRGGVLHFFEIPMLVEKMTARGVPLPRLTLLVGSGFQTVAGLMVMGGFYTMAAAWGLAVFTVFATIMFLNFWDMEGAARDAARNSCFSNLAFIGAFLILAAC